jgi:hypothetical protein
MRNWEPRRCSVLKIILSGLRVQGLRGRSVPTKFTAFKLDFISSLFGARVSRRAHLLLWLDGLLCAAVN